MLYKLKAKAIVILNGIAHLPNTVFEQEMSEAEYNSIKEFVEKVEEKNEVKNGIEEKVDNKAKEKELKETKENKPKEDRPKQEKKSLKEEDYKDLFKDLDE